MRMAKKSSKKHNTLILDLDQTCVNTWTNSPFSEQIKKDPNLSKFFRVNQPDGLAFEFELKNTSFFGVKRPHLKEFLTFAHDYFDNIVVWSAATEDYVHKVCKSIFSNDGFPLPRLIWSRPECDYEDDDEFYHKPIKKMIANAERKKLFRMIINKTFIVDDRDYTFTNNKDNGILIPQWSDKMTLEKLLDRESDTAFLQLMSWLNRPEIIMAKNYSKVPKDNIFH